jgi:putative acetyltransferase
MGLEAQLNKSDGTRHALPMVEIQRVSAPNADVRALIDELERELSAHYSAEQRHGLALEAIFQSHVRFFVARIGGLAAGCGGIALFTHFAEIKRMYVRPEARGRGVADAIIARLTAETLDAGLAIMRLETGTRQHAAIRFYQRCGFQPCEPFEPYSSMPPHAIATSVFLEKRLVAR